MVFFSYLMIASFRLNTSSSLPLGAYNLKASKFAIKGLLQGVNIASRAKNIGIEHTLNTLGLTIK